MSVEIKSGSTSDKAFVDTEKNIAVNFPGYTGAGVERQGGPSEAGFTTIQSENDPGSITGARKVLSPETEGDYRLRVSQDFIYDDETFNYTAQNTSKHNYLNTTMTATWNAGGVLTNATSITTTTTGAQIRSYAYFPIFNSGILTYIQQELSFSAQPTANTIVDFGAFISSGANPFTPTDGVYFRINSGGVFGVINHNGSESTTSAFSFTYNNNEVYKFTITVSNNETQFWINDVLYGTIATPVGQAQPCMSSSLPYAIRHAITGGAAGSVYQATLRGYGISTGGGQFTKESQKLGNSIYGSYTGLSGGTIGMLANYNNSANPTAAVPTNTTAALGTGLGGQFWETDTLAVTIDGIICSYQVPVPTVNLPGRRLCITGVAIDSFVQTALTGGGYVAQFSLATNHTALSLATAQSASTKTSVRIPLGAISISAGVGFPNHFARIEQDFSSAPIYVNPGEFVAVVKKKIGTAPSAGVIGYVICFKYGWE
jgi:hypothetical protein